MRWQEKRYATGIHRLDDGQRQLFEQLDLLLGAAEPVDRQRQFEQTLAFFEQYAHNHLTIEEALMEEWACPLREENRQDHQLLRIEIARIRDDFGQNGISEYLYAHMLAVAVQWMEAHVAHVDTVLRRFQPASHSNTAPSPLFPTPA